MKNPDFQYVSSGLAETEALGKEILEACKGRRIFAIYGELGAGKTTLVNAFCEFLKTEDVTTSPTFSIVNEYHYPGGKIYHFDFYRIERLEEAYDIGFEEYLDSGEYCFIEWPEKIEGLIPEEATEIRIVHEGPDKRKISIYLN